DYGVSLCSRRADLLAARYAFDPARDEPRPGHRRRVLHREHGDLVRDVLRSAGACRGNARERDSCDHPARNAHGRARRRGRESGHFYFRACQLRRDRRCGAGRVGVAHDLARTHDSMTRAEPGAYTRSMRQFPLVRSLLAAAVCLVTFPSQAFATDLTGHWLTESAGSGNGTQLDISQTGDLVTLLLPGQPPPGYPGGSVLGTLTGNALAGQSGPPYFRARVIAGDTVIDGGTPLVYNQYGADYRLLAARCECFDGNSFDGD